jgi:DNA replication and repair protein RecF
VGLGELRLADVRCLATASLELHPRFNLITGANGSGKTSILEAIYLLARGRSFRTRHSEQLIRHGEHKLLVFGRLSSELPGAMASPSTSLMQHAIGVAYHRKDGVEARIDGSAITSLAQLSAAFPAQVIDPGIHRLVEEGPLHRRRWLDWAVFHVEPTFVLHWQQFSRALRQRNAALKAQAEASVWDPELARLGELLDISRTRLIEALQPFWAQTLSDLAAPSSTLGYFAGWSRAQSLTESLRAHLESDRERGSTSYGPHRFDVVLKLEGRPVRDVVSRGQQKLLGAAMTLTMARYLTEVTGSAPALLLDDPAAELDEMHTEALLHAVGGLGSQLVVTALRPQDTALGAPDRVFHVEQQGVKRL